jgi:hypothetical protein
VVELHSRRLFQFLKMCIHRKKPQVVDRVTLGKRDCTSARQLGVSRFSVREALRVAEAQKHKDASMCPGSTCKGSYATSSPAVLTFSGFRDVRTVSRLTGQNSHYSYCYLRSGSGSLLGGKVIQVTQPMNTKARTTFLHPNKPTGPRKRETQNRGSHLTGMVI